MIKALEKMAKEKGEKYLSLKNPGTTRWDGEFMCMSSVLNLKESIVALAMDTEGFI